MVSELPLPGLSRRRTRRLCEGATDFKQTRSVVKCEHRVCVWCKQLPRAPSRPGFLVKNRTYYHHYYYYYCYRATLTELCSAAKKEHTQNSHRCAHTCPCTLVNTHTHTHTHTQSLLMAFFLNTNTFHPHVSCELVHAVSSASQQIPAARRCVYVFVQAE